VSLPLVSCIMPTKNRREFVPKAIEYFLRQTYPNKELLVANDGEEDLMDLIPDVANVLYFRTNPYLTLGRKRNVCCQAASGDLIAIFDDDDFYGPDRLADQVARFTSGVGTEVCGIQHPLFYDLRTGRSFKYQYRGGRYLYSATLMYTREFWARSPFPDVQVGAGNSFILGPGRLDHAAFIQGANWYVGIAHDGNNSPKDFSRQEYGAQSEAATMKRLGADWPFYQGLRERMGVAA